MGRTYVISNVWVWVHTALGVGLASSRTSAQLLDSNVELTGSHEHSHSQDAGACWETVDDLGDFEVLPWVQALTDSGIKLKQDGPPLSLIKSSLRKSAMLSHSDLLQAALHPDLVDANDSSTRKFLVQMLCEYVAPGDDAFK